MTAIVTTAGTPANGYRYRYDPYGQLISTGTPPRNPWRYAGGYHDEPTGLTKFGTRYYDPALGRWTQRDPIAGAIAMPRTLNRYVYAAGDPVNRVDPTGYWSLSLDCPLLGEYDDGGCVGGDTYEVAYELQTDPDVVALELIIAAAVFPPLAPLAGFLGAVLTVAAVVCSYGADCDM